MTSIPTWNYAWYLHYLGCYIKVRGSIQEFGKNFAWHLYRHFYDTIMLELHYLIYHVTSMSQMVPLTSHQSLRYVTWHSISTPQGYAPHYVIL